MMKLHQAFIVQIFFFQQQIISRKTIFACFLASEITDKMHKTVESAFNRHFWMCSHNSLMHNTLNTHQSLVCNNTNSGRLKNGLSYIEKKPKL